MANLVLTRRCNESCSFCFAPNDRSLPMSLAEVERLSRELKAEGRACVPLVGGEPTLHPKFVECIDLILSLGMNIRVFTHGKIVKNALARLSQLAPERCLCVVNASATLTPDGNLDPQVRATLERLGPRACLGLTLLDAGPPRAVLVRLYDEYPLARLLRLGLAQPTLEGDNRWVDYRKPGLGAYITELAVDLHRRGVRVEFDCGFVACTFTAEERSTLASVGSPLRSVCGVIPDVAAGGMAWPCYPLSSRYTIAGGGLVPLARIRQKTAQRLRGFRAAGLYPECRDCEFFADGSCIGGCLARVIPTFSPVEERAS